jgi:hypothetical protein
MGKLNFIITVLCFILPIQNICGQNYLVNYELKYKPCLSDTLHIKENYSLEINIEKKKSIFYSKNLLLSPFNSIVIKDFQKKEFQKLEYISTNLFKLDYEFPNSWKLLEEKKQILTYQCSSASIDFGGRTWIAWYTSQIPFQDGPYKFDGLPGLILEIKSTDDEYSFQFSGIEKTNDFKSIPSNIASNFISKENQLDYKKKLLMDPTIGTKTSNSGLMAKAYFNGEEITERDKDRFRIESFKKFINTHNNPIEKGDIWVK